MKCIVCKGDGGHQTDECWIPCNSCAGTGRILMAFKMFNTPNAKYAVIDRPVRSIEELIAKCTIV